MTRLQATVEVFWTAFRALPKGARKGFLDRLVIDRQTRNELEDRFDNQVADHALKEQGRISWESLKKSLKR